MARPNELTERDEQQLTNAMIADTEAEIMAEALGDEELDNDGDNSLEQMTDPLEDDVDDAEDEDLGDGRTDTDVDEDEGEEGEEGEDEEDEGVDTIGEEPDDRPQPGVPPGRLREEAERRRSAESEAADLRTQLATLNTTVGELRAFMQGQQQPRPPGQPPQLQPQPQPQPQPSPPTVPPDKFADPDGYDRWFLEEIDKRAEAKARAQFDAFQRQQQQQNEVRLNENLGRAARGSRGAEFEAAYQELGGIDPRTFQPIAGKYDAAMRDPVRREVVARMMHAADPAAELFAWWEQNGGAEWREQYEQRRIEELEAAGYQIVAPQRSRGNGNARQRQQSQQPSHEVRAPQHVYQTRMPPSLNATAGGQRQQIADPEMYDGSEESIAAYAFRR